MWTQKGMDMGMPQWDSGIGRKLRVGRSRERRILDSDLLKRVLGRSLDWCLKGKVSAWMGGDDEGDADGDLEVRLIRSRTMRY